MNTVLTQLIAGIFKPAAELIDEIHTSTEEKIEAKTRMLAVQASIMDSALDYEQKTLQSRADIVNSEAKSEHWVMLVLTGLVVARFMGFEASGMSPGEYEKLWTLIQLGIGGYVGGRSVEKIVKIVKAG